MPAATPMRKNASRRQLGGIEIRNTSFGVARRYLLRRLRARRKTLVFFANAHFIEACQPFRAGIASDRDVLIVNDGLGVDLASRLMYHNAFRENLNGSDLVPRFLSELERDQRVYLLGSAPEAVAEAARRLGAMPHVEVVGWTDGYSFWTSQQRVLDEIAALRTDILLVAFGNPVQEAWALFNKHRVDATLVFAVGALLDFLGGAKQRAPEPWRRLRLEWAHRLFTEPRRLARRYTIGMLRFFALVVAERQGR
jgi:beta-1,4-glucosyltransferase